MDGTINLATASTAASGPDAKAQLEELRITLHRNGYHPLPIHSHDQPVPKAGKRPAIPRWQKPVADEAEIAVWSDQGGWRTAGNTGVLTGEIVGVDVDVPDAALAAEIRGLVESQLGPTPLVRFGAAPKLLLVYRLDTAATAVMTKIMTPQLVLPDGSKVQVEVLAEGQQFVAFGVHPDTKQPYRWEGASPLDMPTSGLAAVTRDQLRDLVAAAEKLLRAQGGLTVQERAGTSVGEKGDTFVSADASRRTSGGGGVAAVTTADDGEGFFRRVNREALDNIAAWAPAIFPSGRFEKGTGAFRVSSADLNRALQEELSIHPEHGGRDFGEETSCSPIDIVIRHGAEAGLIDQVDPLTGKSDALTAALWLCERLGIEPVTLGYQPEPSEIAAWVADFNKKNFVTHESGHALVMTERYNSALNRSYFSRSRFRDIEQLYRNKSFKVGEKADGTAKRMSAGELWLNHRDRRTYLGGVVFDPSGGEGADQFNLWQGFALTPKLGDWSRMQRHMLEVICANNIDHALYLRGLMARMVQQPSKPGEVAIVLRGPEGVGKGVFANSLLKLFGPHGLQVSNPAHLTGKFNEHLRDVVVLFADECFFAGDKAHTGILKALITGDTLDIEPKGLRTITVPNYLHIVMASNNDWVVPAALDSRRFFVLDVLPLHKGDGAYFTALWRQMEQEGGLEAMLWDLQRDDLSDFDHREIPTTEGLIDQRKRSLSIPEGWWLDVLSRGYVLTSKHGYANHFSQWHEELATEVLFTSYQDFSRQHRDRDQLSREMLGRFLVTMGGISKRLPAGTVMGEGQRGLDQAPSRPRGYRLGALDQARGAFSDRTGLPVKWD